MLLFFNNNMAQDIKDENIDIQAIVPKESYHNAAIKSIVNASRDLFIVDALEIFELLKQFTLVKECHSSS